MGVESRGEAQQWLRPDSVNKCGLEIGISAPLSVTVLPPHWLSSLAIDHHFVKPRVPVNNQHGISNWRFIRVEIILETKTLIDGSTRFKYE